MENPNATQGQLYAVIVTGVVSHRSDIVPLKDSTGRILPVPLFMHPDKAKCDRMKKRLLSKIAKIAGFDLANSDTNTPILGVVPVWGEIKAKVSTRVITEAQKKAMADGRKKKASAGK